MALYLIKSILCLGILLLFHRLLLQKETMHRFNRYFLLLAVLFSFLIPLNTIEINQIGPSVLPLTKVENPINPTVEAYAPLDSPKEYWIGYAEIIWGLYLLVTLILLLRYFRSIRFLVKKIKQNEQLAYRGSTLVLLNEQVNPFSFLHYIFVSKEDFQSGKFTESVFVHESTHVREGHSWDNLFIELLLTFFWFHPALYWARHAIKLNHEFIADQAALKTTPSRQYQIELLSMLISGRNFDLASSLNYSLTKKRLQMMKQKTDISTKVIKIMALAPVLAILVYLMSEKVAAQVSERRSQTVGYSGPTNVPPGYADFHFRLISSEKIELDNKVYTLSQIGPIVKKQHPERERLTAIVQVENGRPLGEIYDLQSVLFDNGISHIDFIQGTDSPNTINSGQNPRKDAFYSKATFIVEDAQGNRVKKTYSQLSDKEKAGLAEPPTVPVKTNPSQKSLDEWKDGEKFAVFLDGKSIPNAKLSGMNPTEIVHSFVSFVHKNARSERYPQEYQVHLLTEEGFEKSFGKDSDFHQPTNAQVFIKEEKY